MTTTELQAPVKVEPQNENGGLTHVCECSTFSLPGIEV